MIGVPLEGVGERISCRLEITPCGRRLRAPDGLVCLARWRRSGPPRGGALLLQSGAERVVALAQLRIDSEGTFELRDRFPELAALSQCLSKLEVRGRIAGIGPDDETQVMQSGLEVALFAQRHAQVEVRGNALGLEREGLPEYLHGLIELAALCECRAEVRVGPRVFRVERDRLPQRRDALGKVGPVEQHNAEPVMRFG